MRAFNHRPTPTHLSNDSDHTSSPIPNFLRCSCFHLIRLRWIIPTNFSQSMHCDQQNALTTKRASLGRTFRSHKHSLIQDGREPAKTRIRIHASPRTTLLWRQNLVRNECRNLFRNTQTLALSRNLISYLALAFVAWTST